MAEVLTIVLPIFVVIAIGFAAVRFGVLQRADMRVLGAFTINFAMPALIIRAFTQNAIQDVIDPRYLGGYAIASLVLFIAVFLLASRLTPQPVTRSAMQAMGASMSNSGFIGYPVASMALGTIGASGLAMCMLVENFVILPLTFILAESGSGSGKPFRQVIGEIIGRLVRNPLLLAIMTGMALAIIGLKLPAPAARVVDLLANASAPVSLFAIGGILAGIRFGGFARGIPVVVVGKLLLHPLAILAMIALMPPRDPALVKAMVIFASVPMITIYPLIGERYGEEDFCAAALLVTTVISFFTISAVLLLVI
jgi:malonate transporter and related proteins